MLFGIGLVGEYVGRIYQQVRERPRYLVQAVLERRARTQPNDARPRVVFAYHDVGVRCLLGAARARRRRARWWSRTATTRRERSGSRSVARPRARARHSPCDRARRSATRRSRGARRARSRPTSSSLLLPAHAAAGAARRWRARGASTCTARCCRGTAAARRSTGRCCTASARPAPRCTRWWTSPTPATHRRRRAVPILPDDTARDVFDKVDGRRRGGARPRAAARCSPAARRAHAAGPRARAAISAGARPRTAASTGRRPRAAIHNLVRAVAPPYPGRLHRRRLAQPRAAAAHARASDAGAPRRAGAAPRERTLSRDCGDGGTLVASLHIDIDGRAAGCRRRSALRCRTTWSVPLPASDPAERSRGESRLHEEEGPASSASTASSATTCRKRILARHRLGGLRHGHADRPHRRPAGRPALPFLRGRHHDQPGVDRVPRPKCDVVLPLVAIATPATYVREPLRVFELDFEANLPIVRACVQLRQAHRLPVDLRGLRHVRATRSSTPRPPNLVLGPIDKPRWIYACSKQLMDRVIYAYGMQDRPRLHAVPAVQLDRRGPRLDPHRQGRQLARDHAVPRPHRARRADQAGRRRHAEARLHLHRRRHRRR